MNNTNLPVFKKTLLHGILLYPHHFIKEIRQNTDLLNWFEKRNICIKDILNIKQDCDQHDFDCFREYFSFKTNFLENNQFTFNEAFERNQSLLRYGKAIPFYYIYPIIVEINDNLTKPYCPNIDNMKGRVENFHRKYHTFFDFIYKMYLMEFTDCDNEDIITLFEKEKEHIIFQGKELSEIFIKKTSKKTEIYGTDYITSFLKRDIFQLTKILQSYDKDSDALRYLKEILYLDPYRNEARYDLSLVIERGFSDKNIDFNEEEISFFIDFIEKQDPYFLLIESLSKTVRYSNNLAFYFYDTTYYYRTIFPLCFKTEVLLTNYILENFQYLEIRSIITRIISSVLGGKTIGKNKIKEITRISDENKKRVNLVEMLKNIENEGLSVEATSLLKFLAFRNYLAHHSYQDDFFLTEKGCQELINSCVLTSFILFKYRDTIEFKNSFKKTESKKIVINSTMSLFYDNVYTKWKELRELHEINGDGYENLEAIIRVKTALGFDTDQYHYDSITVLKSSGSTKFDDIAILSIIQTKINKHIQKLTEPEREKYTEMDITFGEID